MLLPDVLEWIIKEDVPEAMFHFKTRRRKPCSSSLLHIHIGFVCCHIVCAPFTIVHLKLREATHTYFPIVNPSLRPMYPLQRYPAMTVYHKTEGYLLLKPHVSLQPDLLILAFQA